MDLLEFLKDDGLDEICLPLNISDAEISFKLALDYPACMPILLTPADTMKFLHIFSKSPDGKYLAEAKTQEEIDFLEQGFKGTLSGQFQLGSKYEVKEFGIFIGTSK